MNLIFSVFVSRPPPPLPPTAPSVTPPAPASTLRPIAIATRNIYINPSPRTCPYLFPALFRSARALSLAFSFGASTYVRPYLSSVVRFRVIKLARAASLGFYLPEKKRINFERRRRFSAGTLFRFMYANARSGRRQESFILSVLSSSVRLEGEWYLANQWRKVDRKKAVETRILFTLFSAEMAEI